MFQRAKSNKEPYDRQQHTHYPQIVMDSIKSIFRDPANPDLLRRCLHVGTQNVCESLNSFVWSRLPKSTLFQRKTLEIGVFEAIATYDEGNINEGRILQNLGIPPGTNRIKRMKRVNALQIRTAKTALHEIEKSSARRLCSRENYKTWKRKKTSLTTLHIYGPGMY